MRILFAFLVTVLLASPAFAANELQGQPFSEVVESAEKHGVKVEKLSAADTATMDEAIPNRPKPSAIFLLTLNASVIVALVQDGAVIFSTDPIELAKINKILSRTDARSSGLALLRGGVHHRCWSADGWGGYPRILAF